MAAAAEDPLASLREGGRLRVGIPGEEISPYLMSGQDGGREGLDPALTRLLADILGVEAEFVAVPGGARAVRSAVAAGQVHLGLGRLSRGLGRQPFVAQSRPYAVVERALLYNRLEVARNAPGGSARSLLARPGSRIAVLHDGGAADYLRATHPGVLLQAFPSIQGAADALLHGDITLLLVDRPRLRHWLADHTEVGLELGYEELTGAGDALVITLSWRNRRLFDWLNGTLDILAQQGALSSLTEVHLHQRWPE
jgi:ABC-type amino acid transport substrate-binding protein